MKAAVYEGPGRISVREVPGPERGEGEVLVKIRACAICGTDARIFKFGQKNVVPPHIIGHEIAGTVEESVKGGPEEGDNVVLVTSVGCGECRFCRRGWYNLCDRSGAIGYLYPGGFAQYLSVPEAAVRQGNIIPFPPAVSFPEAAVAEPLSCCINGQEYLGITPGDTVAIFGCGPIGCMHAGLARAKNVSSLIMLDVDERRLEVSRRFGPDHVVNSAKTDPVEKILDITGGEGADVIIVACGVNSVQEQSVRAAARKGRISFFAGLPRDNPLISLDANLLHYREISVFGAFASHPGQYSEALELIASGKFDASRVVTHRYPLEKIHEGFEAAMSGEGLKVVIEPWE